QFNDRFGHDAGDAVLRAVGQVLRASVREGGLAFRYGGEEFALLLPGLDVERAQARAEVIRQRVAQISVAHEGVNLGPITLSAGVASTPLHCPPVKLIAAADAALLRAKQAGRDRVVTAAVRDASELAA
ncbi:MAG: GGDEF domain-containing protein, partial [Sphingomonas sp.]